MDHLPLAKNTPWGHIHVPYYNCQDFGYSFTSPWDTWADRKNYTEKNELYYRDLRESGYPNHLRPQLAAFIQSWLWFGVLHEFLQRPYCAEDWLVEYDFVADETLYKYRISTDKLLDVLDAWCLEVLASNDTERSTTLARIDRLLDLANLEESQFAVSFRTMYWVSDGLPEPLILSFKVLLATLAIARDAAFPKEVPHDAGSGVGNFRALEERLLLDGWCPVEIKRFRKRANIFAKYCVTSLGPVSTLNHLGCKARYHRCEASQVDNETYQTQHLSADCVCPMSRNISRDVATIISQGQVPLVRFEKGSMDVELQALDLAENRDTVFVAISHVWSDGLGNPQQNSIAMCQLKQVQDQVERASSRLEKDPPLKCFFWLDTLCVPVGDGMEVVRSAAIQQMVHVYKLARLTLILSKDLRQVTSQIEAWELSARINRTAWFNRLWTLHEGVISRRSEFQLADSSVMPEELTERAETCPSLVGRMIRRFILQHASRPYTLMSRFRNLPLRQRGQEIWSAVQWRNTSNLEDETVCLANMLEMDLSPVLAISRQDPDVCAKRMKAFILQQKLFPRDSPFRTSRPREGVFTLSEPGFRWAPTSFVFREGDDDMEISPLVEATSEGLYLNIPAFLPQLDWRPFFTLITSESYIEPHQIDRVATDFREGNSTLVFMVPHEWDYHHTIFWQTKSFRRIGQEMLDSTVPVILLQEDLANIDLDQRGLYFAGQQIRDFWDEAASILDDLDSTGPVRIDDIHVLLVAVPVKQSSLSHPVQTKSLQTNVEANGIRRATICGYGLMRKTMFETRRYEAAYQMGWGSWPFSKHQEEKIGWFEPLPSHTSWCIG